jgi:5-methylcytosine-specific restriction endonuclease McrA
MPVAPRLGVAQGDNVAGNRMRTVMQPWRKWYSTAAWRSLRIETFKRDGFTCQMEGCGRIEGRSHMLVCDHREPHRGDKQLFWDRENLQTLCKPCHDSRKQKLERGGARW